MNIKNYQLAKENKIRLIKWNPCSCSYFSLKINSGKGW